MRKRSLAAGLLALLLGLAGCAADRSPSLPVVVTTVDLGAQPRDLVPGLKPGTLLVTCFKDDTVWEVGLEPLAAARPLAVRQGPAALVPDPGRGCVYCLHLRENALSILAGDPLRVERSLGTGDISLASARLRPDSGELVVCDGVSALHTLIPKGMQVKNKISAGRYPQKLAFSRDGRLVYVTLKGENALIAIDLETSQEVARVATGIYPRDVLLVGNTACVSNYGSGDVSLIDITTFTERARIKVRRNPNALAARGNTLWVACEDSYRLLAVDVSRALVIGSVKLGFYPGAVLALENGSLAVADPRGNRLALVTPRDAAPAGR